MGLFKSFRYRVTPKVESMEYRQAGDANGDCTAEVSIGDDRVDVFGSGGMWYNASTGKRVDTIMEQELLDKWRLETHRSRQKRNTDGE